MAAVAEAFALEPHLEVCRARPAHFEGCGVGMRCDEAVRKGEELLRVPLSKCWTAEAARSSPELSALDPELLEAVSDESLIALHLLAVRAAAGRQGAAEEEVGAEGAVRRAHVKLLEAAEFETLLDWSPEDLQLLAGSKWAMVAAQQRADMLEEFSELEEVIGDFLAGLQIDFKAFLWAHRLLLSRSVHFYMEDGSTLQVLGPGQDMFNHSLDAPVSDEDVNLATAQDGHRSLVIRAYKDFEAGEQACYSYGGASNGRLLMMAGFVLPGNAFDAVELQFMLPPCSDAARPLFQQLARGLDAGAHAVGSVAVETKSGFMDALPDGSLALHAQLTGGAVGPQLERVLAFFRLVRLCRGGAAPSLEELAASDGDRTIRLAVLKQLRDHLQQMLAAYPSALAEDEAALRAAEEAGAVQAPTPKEERRRESSLRVLVGEKRIFAQALAWLVARDGASSGSA